MSGEAGVIIQCSQNARERNCTLMISLFLQNAIQVLKAMYIHIWYMEDTYYVYIHLCYTIYWWWFGWSGWHIIIISWVTREGFGTGCDWCRRLEIWQTCSEYTTGQTLTLHFSANQRIVSFMLHIWLAFLYSSFNTIIVLNTNTATHPHDHW